MNRNDNGKRIPDKDFLIRSHIQFEKRMEELKRIYADTERAYKKYVLKVETLEED